MEFVQLITIVAVQALVWGFLLSRTNTVKFWIFGLVGFSTLLTILVLLFNFIDVRQGYIDFVSISSSLLNVIALLVVNISDRRD